MTVWGEAELQEIVQADDLHVAPYREDGETPGTPTWIWCVAVDGELFVRAYHGTESRWYGAAVRQGAGRIIAAGNTHHVSFTPVAGAINRLIDAAYREKYQGSPYLQPMVGDRARAATVRVRPRPEDGVGER